MSTEEQISNIHKEETVRQEDATYKPHSDPKKVKAAKQARDEQASGDSFQSAPPPAAKQEAEDADSSEDYEKLLAEFKDLDDKYKRLWADQQNMVKRNAREREELYKYAAVSTIEAILPALDNFDFALKSINENTSTDEVLKGIELLRSQLMMALQSVGLEEIAVAGAFDPEQHEAISKLKDPEKEEGTIIDVVKKGFKLKDKVVRPATVVVSTKSD